jgi:four helix bundle protein
LAEESETEVWLDFSKDLNYINVEKHKYFIQKYDEVARMLSSMIDNPDKFCH